MFVGRCWLVVVGCWLLVVGRWSLVVVGCWLLVVLGGWRLAVGGWRLAGGGGGELFVCVVRRELGGHCWWRASPARGRGRLLISRRDACAPLRRRSTVVPVAGVCRPGDEARTTGNRQPATAPGHTSQRSMVMALPPFSSANQVAAERHVRCDVLCLPAEGEEAGRGGMAHQLRGRHPHTGGAGGRGHHRIGQLLR